MTRLWRVATSGLVTMAALTFGLSSAHAAPEAPPVDGVVEQMDALATDLMTRSGIPGMSVGIVLDGQLVFAKGYGVRDVDTGAPVTVDTAFQLASVSKSVSASAVASLVTKGVLNWSDPVTKWLPWFALSNPATTKALTVADLFSMRSGLPQYSGDDLEALGYSRREILERQRFLPLSPFRISYAYTNYGVVAGAEAAAAAAKRPWNDVVQQEIFDPLGMTTSTADYAVFTQRPNHAVLHYPVAGHYESLYERSDATQGPAGSYSSTVIDMSKWMRMELANGWFEGAQVVGPRALIKANSPQVRQHELATPSALPKFYGFGMNYFVDANGNVRLSHTGALSAGAGTGVLMLPGKNAGIVVLTNAFAGVAEAMLSSFADLVSSGSIQTDYYTAIKPIIAGLYPDPMSVFGTRPDPTTPAHAASWYVGEYSNDYVGTVRVVQRSGVLSLQLGPHRLPASLEHWDGDQFLALRRAIDGDSRFMALFDTRDGLRTLTLTGFPEGLNTLVRR